MPQAESAHTSGSRNLFFFKDSFIIFICMVCWTVLHQLKI